MGTTTVTQAQWKAVMDNNPSYFQEAVIHAKFPDVWKSLMANVAIDNLPVETVSWNDAVDFCKRLGAKEGRHYRLPTDAEWEYACRAGTTTTYNTGDGEAALASAGWYSGNTRIPGLRDRSKIT
jgi:formylglycine-generating enzyme required for sulfatase activity